MFDSIKDMVYCELDEIAHQGKLDMNTVQVLGELVDILKDIGSVEMFEEGINIQDEEYPSNNSYGYGGGYSQRRMPIYYNNGSSYNNSYNNSYRNGGRMMNNNYSRRGRGYSYDDSKQDIIEELNHLMMKTTDQHDKDAIQNLVDQMSH